MSYDSQEQSTHDAAPVEVYKFIGSFKTYRYTSSHKQETVNGETYQPIFIKRGVIKAGTQEDSSLTMEVTLPFDVEVALDYAYAQSPPALRLELRRYHAGGDPGTEWRMIWSGEVKGFSVVRRECTLRVPSAFGDMLESEVPNVYFQTPCNHTLYDARCGVSRAIHTTVSTIVAVDGLFVEVVDDGVADNLLRAGEVVVTRTGERRMVLSNVVNLIHINFPFVDALIGDEVQLSEGCDLAHATCVNQFANGDRHGGHPFMPGDNPFEGGL